MTVLSKCLQRYPRRQEIPLPQKHPALASRYLRRVEAASNSENVVVAMDAVCSAAGHLLQTWVLGIPRWHQCAELVSGDTPLRYWTASCLDCAIAVQKPEVLLQGCTGCLLLGGEVSVRDEGRVSTVQSSIRPGLSFFGGLRPQIIIGFEIGP